MELKREMRCPFSAERETGAVLVGQVLARARSWPFWFVRGWRTLCSKGGAQC